MQYRNLGKSGLKVSAIGLGTNQFGGKVDLMGTKNILAAALDAGVNLIDTADVYQNGRSEEFIGEALKDRRQQALIATKVYFKVGEGPNDQGASRQHIMDGVEVSLMFTELRDGKVKISLRSTGNIVIGDIAIKLGGGGHNFAAGALLHKTLDEAIPFVLELVKQLIDAG